MSARPSYEFGPFVVDADKRLLLRDGEAVPLAPKVLETLLALIESRERVLTKDELLKQVWGDTVVEEGGLTRNVSILRKTLGEKPDDHRYIVTVPARGYRFVADVRERRADEEASAAGVPAVSPVPDPDPRPRGPVWVWRGLGAAVLAALALAAFAYVRLRAPATDPGRPAITSLAVLPLENLSGDPSQDYFADGMTEALIANLARIRALRVVSRTSVMRFKGARTSLPDIARALGVDAVIEGSVQRTSDRVRINIQLIHAPTDAHLWAREYERELTDVLKLQGEVARAVSEEIRIQVTAEERARMASAGTVNPAAHQEYLLGRYYLWKLTKDDLTRAVDHFERATRLDPGYAAAHAGLSHAWWWRGVWGGQTFREIEAPSRAAARKALELDPRLAEAHVSMGRIKFGHDWDWTGAEKDFARAQEIDPNNLDAHFFHAMLFMALGRFPESIAHIERAEQLDPLSATVESAFGRILYRARRFDEAVSHLHRALELEPGNGGVHERLGDVYDQMGRYADALAAYQKGGSAPGYREGLARIYARMGRQGEARRLLAGLEAKPGGLVMSKAAEAYAALGDKDEAFRLLFAMAEQGGDTLNYVKVEPPLDGLHSDPRWPVLLRRMNLPFDGDAVAVSR
jgi:TolB-like protein/DNA-binding winged helix-turn-helix (wHTH) protein/thioredoxin-like negative regulator of GroEL